MAFIKNLTERLLEAEYRPIQNFYSSKSIGENTEHIGFVKQVGAVIYGIIIINSDKKYDYMGFYKDTLNYFFKGLKKVIAVGIFVSENPDDELIKFSERDIEDYTEDLVDIRWVVDTGKNRLIVKGSQPDKIMELDRLIKSSFDNGEFTAAQDLNLIRQKTAEKRQADLKSNNTVLTSALIIINGIILLITLLPNNSLIYKGGISREFISSGEWYRLITYMFLHGGINHYMCNGLSLYIFGGRVEKYYGKINMLAIYIISGLGAGILSALFNTDLAVGASGAIFGLMAAVLMYTRVKKRSIEGFDTYFMIIYAIIGILSGFFISNIDNWGHIGGFLTGVLTSLFILKGESNARVQ